MLNPTEKEAILLQMLRSNIFIFQPTPANIKQRIEPYYVDMASLFSFPQLHRLTTDWYSNLLKTKNFNHICGVETASLPLVGSIGYKDNLSTLYLRKKRKEYGMKKIVEGYYKKGDSLYIIDDVSVEAAPTMAFVKSVEEEGLKVKGVLVTYKIVTDKKCKDLFESEGYEFDSMLSYNDLADVLKKHHGELGLSEDTPQIVIDCAESLG